MGFFILREENIKKTIFSTLMKNNYAEVDYFIELIVEINKQYIVILSDNFLIGNGLKVFYMNTNFIIIDKLEILNLFGNSFFEFIELKEPNRIIFDYSYEDFFFELCINTRKTLVFNNFYSPIFRGNCIVKTSYLTFKKIKKVETHTKLHNPKL